MADNSCGRRVPFYETFYLKCARECADRGDVDNAFIFLDLANDFYPENYRNSEIIRDAYEKGIEFSLGRAEDMLYNREKDQMIETEITAKTSAEEEALKKCARNLRIKCIQSLLEDACVFMLEHELMYKKNITNVDAFRIRMAKINEKLRTYIF